MVLHELRLPNIQIFLLWNEELSIAPDALTMGEFDQAYPGRIHCAIRQKFLSFYFYNLLILKS